MKVFQVDVWGDFACFTRPEAKVERLSYPVMTPSAARGILDAIFVKPLEFGWRIDQIDVLNPIQFIAIRRNEVKEKISDSAVLRAKRGTGEPPIIIADATREMVGTDEKGRTQRQTIALKNVRYRIYAHIETRKGFENQRKGLEEQAERRIKRGKCYYQPYFGCREFPAYFEPGTEPVKPIDLSQDLGWMVYDTFDLDEVVIDNAPAHISLFFARLESGSLKVPPWDSPLVKRPVKGG